MLKTRLLTAFVLLPLLLAAMFYAPTMMWGGLLMVMMLIGAWEWGALAAWRPMGRMAYALGVGILGLLAWHFVYRVDAPDLWISRAIYGVSLLFWLLVAPFWLARNLRVRSPLAMAVVGAVLLLPTWLALLQMQMQPWLLLMLMAIVWISDTSAYFCGKRWGRRKLAPGISPGKTWEGVYGALAGVTVYYLLLSFTGHAGPGVLHGIAGCGIFLLLTVLGIEGDLFESWIKRTAGVKDSGTVFPGHGGVLDRIDALTAAMPAAALVLSGA